MRIDEVLTWESFVVLGHRGAPVEKTENTLDSFIAAVEAGADGVELDIHLSLDQVPVVSHDPEISTTAGETVRIRERKWSDLAALEVLMGGKAGRLCRLDDVLEALRSCLIDVELKDLPLGVAEFASSRIGEVVARSIKAHRAEDRVLFTSFYIPHLERAAGVAPEIPRGWLLAPTMQAAEAARLASIKGMACLLPHTSGLGGNSADLSRVVDAVREQGPAIIVWTVNDPSLASDLRAAGAAGVITDEPAAISKALQRGND